MREISIEPINKDNVDVMADLLLERGNTLPDYVFWKYGQDDDVFRGVIAQHNGMPAGCFGLVPRKLQLDNGELLACGWFADWFVMPDFQGLGLGKRLLLALTEHCPVVFGHPRPVNAREMCLANGYHVAVLYQSLRRFYFHHWRYERIRTHYLPKAGWRYLRTRRRYLTEQIPSDPYSGIAGHFVDRDSYGQWMFTQPTIPEYQRERTAEWQSDTLRVFFADDINPLGERQRLVAYFEGEGSRDAAQWRQFIENARASQCDTIDFFTTDPLVDRALKLAGAMPQPDPPVLVNGLGEDVKHLYLQGWDKESWLNRSMYSKHSFAVPKTPAHS